MVGSLLDERYRIDDKIAAGGFGVVYRATDLHAHRPVAIKVLHPHLVADPQVVARFRREARTLAKLQDPHTILAYDLCETAGGTLYIVMELLSGVSLDAVLRETTTLPWRRAIHIARGVCSSLAEAHALGIVHRDLKPQNIHLERCGTDPDFVKVLDFGIAKIVQGNDATAAASDLTQTQGGRVLGTVEYMSPEQATGEPITPRSDIFALGVVMYEMLCGYPPFSDDGPLGALHAMLTRPADRLFWRAVIPSALDYVVMRCLERDPRKRYPSVATLAAALESVEQASATRSTQPYPSAVPRR
jgi:eukaryotic-like serine/threonine-protein kinase